MNKLAQLCADIVKLLETPTSGEILYHGENVVRRGFNAAGYRSHVGMVFQSFNLFNNMTVLENCIVGQVKVLKRSREEAYDHAMYYLEKVQRQAPADLRRSEAACGHCPGLGHGPGSPALRRAHLRS